MNEKDYNYIEERERQNAKLARISYEMTRVYREYLYYKDLQDKVLHRIVELENQDKSGLTEQEWLGNE